MIKDDIKTGRYIDTLEKRNKELEEIISNIRKRFDYYINQSKEYEEYAVKDAHKKIEQNIQRALEDIKILTLRM